MKLAFFIIAACLAVAMVTNGKPLEEDSFMMNDYRGALTDSAYLQKIW